VTSSDWGRRDYINIAYQGNSITLPILGLDFKQNFGKNNCLKLLLGNNVTFMVGHCGQFPNYCLRVKNLFQRSNNCA